MEDERLLVGINTCDDAGVYLLNETTALIQTVDFFTPVVDDPYDFGRIAAANALSDVYAMGGRPLTAMNIICYPTRDGDLDTLARILQGGVEKVKEAGALLVGGHSVEDREPKYGLAVTGVVHPDRLLTNAKARPGDVLVLTKPLGTGVITTALKADMVPPDLLRLTTEQMAALNASAADAAQETGVNACTDVTGFGFLGHAREMAEASGVGLVIDSGTVPLLPMVYDFAAMGLLPAGAHANRCFLGEAVLIEEAVPLAIADLLFDPQTSGGLLISVPQDRAEKLLAALETRGVRAAAVGRVVEDHPGRIRVTA